MANNARLSTLKTPAGPRISPVQVSGSFATNAAASPAAASNVGGPFSVARVAQGQLRVTLPYSVKHVMSAVCTLQTAAVTTLRAQMGPIVAAPTSLTSTFDIWILDAGGLAQDLAANANNRVNFQLVVNNGAV